MSISATPLFERERVLKTKASGLPTLLLAVSAAEDDDEEDEEDEEAGAVAARSLSESKASRMTTSLLRERVVSEIKPESASAASALGARERLERSSSVGDSEKLDSCACCCCCSCCCCS